MSALIERAVTFAPNDILVGVVTSPAADATPGPCALFLNAGRLHRIGPNRLYVTLARRLAERGITSLRFDLSGVGDSAVRRDEATFRAAAVRDVADAMTYLAAAHDVRGGFILAGLCSGADLAYRVALLDPRVRGLILIDGLPYRTRRAVLHTMVRRVVYYGAWRKILTPLRAVRLLRRAAGGAAPTSPPSGLGARDVPSRREAEAGLRTLTERGVRLLALYTEGREYAYRAQFAHCFPSVRRDRVRVEYLEGADHTFTLLANQARLVNIIDDWISAWR